MPESSGFNALDTGLRRYDELIRASLKICKQVLKQEMMDELPEALFLVA
jgi:hypothetical protein